MRKVRASAKVGHPVWFMERNPEKQTRILRLTTPRLKKTPGAPFAQDDSFLLWCSCSALSACLFLFFFYWAFGVGEDFVGY